MKNYLAPLEGVTTYIYRNAHHTYFGGIDKYFAPFIIPTKDGKMKTREYRDILPENNRDLYVVPQILTNKAADFLRLSDELHSMGYDEININLGCPAGTVVSKFRGAGFLAKPKELDEFLEEIFTHTQVKVSVKTRLGMKAGEEFYELLDIYNKYPLEELILHPRVREDYYKNTPNMDMFQYAIENSKNPLCYNGDIFLVKDYVQKQQELYKVDRFMMGRGIIGNPGLLDQVNQKKISKSQMKEFHDEIYSQYQLIMDGDRNVLFKMKEIWLYMGKLFINSDSYAKKIKKADRKADYEIAVNNLFRELEI